MSQSLKNMVEFVFTIDENTEKVHNLRLIDSNLRMIFSLIRKASAHLTDTVHSTFSFSEQGWNGNMR
uniref:Uncharacterized protein n=1 Tax=Anopheles atroparvus TaxID=41427 RepID=A0AAG5DQX1_ANOAO